LIYVFFFIFLVAALAVPSLQQDSKYIIYEEKQVTEPAGLKQNTMHGSVTFSVTTYMTVTTIVFLGHIYIKLSSLHVLKFGHWKHSD
jgi:hypothetical protein